jgi:hypothetical protein
MSIVVIRIFRGETIGGANTSVRQGSSK